MKNPGKGKETMAVGLRLPIWLVDLLKQRDGGAGVTESIKVAIGALLHWSRFDRPTRGLASDVAFLAKRVEELSGARWHEDANAFDALRAAIDAMLDEARPSSAEATKFREDEPRTMGRTLARVRRDLWDFTDWAEIDQDQLKGGTDEEATSR